MASPAGVVPLLLGDLVVSRPALHLAAHGTSHVKPKHHLNHLIPLQIFRDGRVNDEFIIERMHLRVKSVANEIRNTQRFERSVLARVLTAQINTLNGRENIASGLRGRVHESRQCPGLLLSNSLVAASLSVARGDIVLHYNEAGLVETCGRDADGDLIVIVNALLHIATVTAHSEHWQSSGLLQVWSAKVLRCPAAWYAVDDGVVTVV